ncbi:Gfo/Idh/MocA family oxidoreductase [Rhizobium sp. 2MFCol3.1]|uniref:Gfo/Idh/MocA family protein n=1 Tax=Rhizobium sp. 2MFCol3.1 TaxID=1246459 RepID=UPI00037E8B86|nr:Gfo/Idh/MocA family oxidoreductase [Rhizobium sp. 2MFCol3.1]
MRVGIIGCGNISDIYAANSKLFHDIDIVACADVVPEASKRIAGKFGLEERSVDKLLSSKDIDIVLNLTIPSVHAEVSRAVLDAGKHVYVEKPLATSLEDGIDLVRRAKEKGLRIGCAPDTILGAGQQTARRNIDDGSAGQILTGVAAIMSKGMEHWHPNPSFFYQAGGGPVLDIGPYYISSLCNLLGPVASVYATGQISPAERIYGAEGPNKGKTFKVETFTTINAILKFESGATITFIASWDIWRNGMRPIELHGTKASLRVPDPDTFGGDVELSDTTLPLNTHDAEALALVGQRPDWNPVDTTKLPFGAINYPFGRPTIANYRSLGLAEMANAIANNRPHRCSGDFSLHTLAVMLGVLQSAELKREVQVSHRAERPEALTPEQASSLRSESL